MRKLSLMAAAVAGLYGAQAGANELEFRLNDDVISTNATFMVTPQAQIYGGYTYSELEGSLTEIGAEAVNPQGVHTLAIGGKYLYVSADERSDNGAIALTLRYRLDIAPQISFRAEGDYSPSVLAFDDFDNYTRVDMSMNFMAMPTVELFAGWRELRFNYINSTEDLIFEEGIYLGTRFLF
jgi:hypothetical protein